MEPWPAGQAVYRGERRCACLRVGVGLVPVADVRVSVRVCARGERRLGVINIIIPYTILELIRIPWTNHPPCTSTQRSDQTETRREEPAQLDNEAEAGGRSSAAATHGWCPRSSPLALPYCWRSASRVDDGGSKRPGGSAPGSAGGGGRSGGPAPELANALYMAK